MEYRLTEEEFAHLTEIVKAVPDDKGARDLAEYNEYVDFLIKERFAGDTRALINEIAHRKTGDVVFHEKQTQDFKKSTSRTRRLERRAQERGAK